MNIVPIYARVFNILKKEIVEGDVPIGDFLPTEIELERRFRVSRTSIRRAIDLLSREGYVQAQQGRGTVVLDYKTKQNLNKVTSVSETMRKKGFDVTYMNMSVDTVSATSSMAEIFKIPTGSDVVRFQRLQLADGKPVSIMKNYIPKKDVPDVEDKLDVFTSLYDFLETKYDINIDSANDRITAKSANLEESNLLEVPAGTALICLERICYENNRPVVFDRVAIVASMYQFEIHLEGRDKFIQTDRLTEVIP